MQISIETLFGKSFKFDVDNHITPFDLKRDIELKYGIPENQQLLLCAGRILEENEPLSSNSETISKFNNTIHLLLKLKGGLQIFVKLFDGKVITVDLSEEDSVAVLKKKVADKEGSSVEGVFFTFGSKILDKDEVKVKDYGVPKEATLHYFVRLKGGLE